MKQGCDWLLRSQARQACNESSSSASDKLCKARTNVSFSAGLAWEENSARLEPRLSTLLLSHSASQASLLFALLVIIHSFDAPVAASVIHTLFTRTQSLDDLPITHSLLRNRIRRTRPLLPAQTVSLSHPRSIPSFIAQVLPPRATQITNSCQ